MKSKLRKITAIIFLIFGLFIILTGIGITIDNPKDIGMSIAMIVMLGVIPVCVGFILMYRKNLENSSKMPYWHIFLIAGSAFFSVIALILSISATTSKDFNSNSIIISVFGIIVALLVGWNIYRWIDLDKTIRESLKKGEEDFNKIKGEYDTKVEEIKKLINEKIKLTEIKVLFELSSFLFDEKFYNSYFVKLFNISQYFLFTETDKQERESYLNHIICKLKNDVGKIKDMDSIQPSSLHYHLWLGRLTQIEEITNQKTEINEIREFMEMVIEHHRNNSGSNNNI